MGFVSFATGLVVGAFLVVIRLAVVQQRRKRPFVQHERAIASNLETVARFRAQAVKKGQPAHLRLANVQQFLVLWNADLASILIGLSEDLMPWAHKLQARLLAITIHDGTLKLSDFLDADWKRKWSPRMAMVELGIAETAGPVFDRLHTSLSALLDPHRDLIAGIRMNIGAHRDQDAETQLQWLEATDPAVLQTLGFQLLEWTNQALDGFILVAKLLKEHARLA